MLIAHLPAPAFAIPMRCNIFGCHRIVITWDGLGVKQWIAEKETNAFALFVQDTGRQPSERDMRMLSAARVHRAALLHTP